MFFDHLESLFGTLQDRFAVLRRSKVGADLL